MLMHNHEAEDGSLFFPSSSSGFPDPWVEAAVVAEVAEVEAAKLRVEVEALRRTRDDLQQRLGVAEAQVRSHSSTLSATYTAQHGVGPPGVKRQGQ